MPQVKYDFDYMNNMTSELIKTNDTIVFLTLGGGYMRGVEHNYYSIKKEGEKTFVQRVSNFQKFKAVEIKSSNFPWLYIKDNFDNFTLDTTAQESINPTGVLVIGTFSEQGPKKCSGIEIKQYSETTMTDRLKKFFDKIKCITVDHKTPFDTIQNLDLIDSFRRRHIDYRLRTK
jgi:hypothetical protein